MKSNDLHEDFNAADSLSTTHSSFEKFAKADQHHLFELFMENSPALAWIADQDSRLYYMNRAYRNTFELDDQWLNKLPTIFPKEYLEQYQENNRKVIRENRMLETLEDGYDQHGRYRVFKVSKFPLGHYEGVALIGACMVDLTNELAAEKALRESNERYHYASQATADVIWEWDVIAEKVYMGEGYEALFGFPSTTQVEELESHIHPDDLPRLQTAINRAIVSSQTRWQMEYRYVCLNGEIKQVINKAFIVRNNQGKALRIIGAIQDLTPFRRLQEELMTEQTNKKKEMIQAALSAQENERNDISQELHDNVNQLLATALLLVNSARSNIADNASLLEQSIGLINKALKENRSLAHRLVSPPFDVQDFDATIKELAAMLHQTCQIHVTLQLPSLTQLKTTNAELRLELYRILQEGITNIFKYAKATKVVIALGRKENAWELLISDDGIGFDPGGRRSGVGFRNIASRTEMLGGHFRVNSSPGNGCQLIVEIPDK